MIEKIVSGGQTGVDRAALDVAIKSNIPHGGWCPKGRLAENGSIPSKYLLVEAESSDYSVRTKLNVRDSDGTLILVPKTSTKITDGTTLTIRTAIKKNKPYLLIDLSNPPSIKILVKWVKENKIKVLNIAGPRESPCPGIYLQSAKYLGKIPIHLCKPGPS